MNKEKFIEALRAQGFGSWARDIEQGKEHPLRALRCMIGCVGDVEATALCEALFERKPHEFFMVYREGGRAPAFKHGTKDAAMIEAKRIARKSGETTHVLAAVEKIEPNAMPTPEEFAKHASLHPYGPSVDTWGLWRVCVEGKMPAVIAVRCGTGGPYASCDSPCGSCLPSDGKWFPLDANGKDVDDLEIPF